jgi:hypothetical protein
MFEQVISGIYATIIGGLALALISQGVHFLSSVIFRSAIRRKNQARKREL